MKWGQRSAKRLQLQSFPNFTGSPALLVKQDPSSRNNLISVATTLPIRTSHDPRACIRSSVLSKVGRKPSTPTVTVGTVHVPTAKRITSLEGGLISNVSESVSRLMPCYLAI